MDVNNVMSTYNLSSLWNNLNGNSSSSSTVPLISNVDASVDENYKVKNYSGGTSASELQDIYQQVEPDYGVGMTYDQNGNMTIPSTTSLPTDGISASESNMVSLLNSDTSPAENLFSNVLSEYNSFEDGTFQENLSSILASNSPFSSDNYVNYLGNNMDATV
ncbi:hypothetical protein IAI10_20640 [Clostridium sp. 19966]|uniref:hypothetical protein n=1 Tax=Clostridium sp. 19966 TaxID=2768166 RepID=UPI0028DE2A25|nr:hypothetical protein [Clostridium sp. 19966]MDT8719061.1 hypothetical protein [Clostridium sp. 19966]